VKRRGRPPLDARYGAINLSVRLTTKAYDDLCQRATQDRQSLSAYVRACLQRPPHFVRKNS
jgi:hypothetical protein